MTALAKQANEVKVVSPGEGESGGLGPGVGVVFKINGADTGGALSVVEHPFDVGAMVPPHVHHREDEISIVLQGSIGFRSEEKEVVLEEGGYIVKPRGEVHAMWNAGSTPARMIEIITPAGLENFFREVVEVTSAGAPNMERLMAISQNYQLPMAEPEWIGEVVARYGLTPPPG
ncbi:hypothetical protein BH23ACT4_BH23ACT4_16720 [soil metagenome]